MATPMFRFDPVELPPEAIAHARTRCAPSSRSIEHLMGFTRGEFNRDFSRAMGKRGWIGMTWPKQYGGHERSSFERYVVIEEMLVAGAPLSAHYTGDRQSGPNLLRFGTEEQKQFFLPKIAAGELTFCIGMSEPNSGSDLAGTRTRAVKVDGGYKINGTKLWTSNAHRADYAILFCKMAQRRQGRTRPSRRRHAVPARPEVARHRHPAGASICWASITSTKSSSPTSSSPTTACWARKATAGTRSPASCRSNAAHPTASWCCSRCCARWSAWPGPHAGPGHRGRTRQTDRAAGDVAQHVAVDRRDAAGRPAAEQRVGGGEGSRHALRAGHSGRGAAVVSDRTGTGGDRLSTPR